MKDEVYFHRELLGYSKELRYVELITLTGLNEHVNTEKREPIIEGKGMFPPIEEATPQANIFSKQRCYEIEKPVVFLSARVHPGEV